MPYHIDIPMELQQAGPTDLIQMLPVRGGHPVYVQKWFLEALVLALQKRETIHISGPTGSAKSSVIDALHRRQENYQAICALLGLEASRVQVFAIEMPTFESPAELWHRRALRQGNTFDEPSTLVEAMKEAAALDDDMVPVIWLREMGRVHAAAVQGGLLDMVYKGDVVLSDGTRIDGTRIGWIADSNYQAEDDSTHALVVFDDALKRRFSVNLTLDYLPADQEEVVLRELHPMPEDEPRDSDDIGEEPDLIQVVVKLGQVIRRHRADGNLLSVPPPTVYGYLTFLRMAEQLPHMSPQQIATVTLLGNASLEDRKAIVGVFNEIFGMRASQAEDPASGAHMF
jgi:hypothetical protein